MSILYNANVTDGLFPDKWNGNTGEPVGSMYFLLSNL